jgi:hypothetical protein
MAVTAAYRYLPIKELVAVEREQQQQRRVDIVDEE